MPETHTLLILAAITPGLAATPGANMACLMSRSMAQGRVAGFISLAGTNAGLLVLMLVSVAGLAGLLTAMPHLWEAIRLIGAERFARLLRRRPALAVVQQRAVGVAMAVVAVALTVEAVT